MPVARWLWLIVASALAADAGSSRADYAARTDEPYHVDVCLRFADDPLMTELYVTSVTRQVRDQLHGFFGPLAHVDLYADAGHWALDRLQQRGRRRVEISPDWLAEAESTAKAFVVHVDHHQGLYRVRWQQIDGRIGWVGPLRETTSADRLWVPRAICLSIYRDFAPSAAVISMGDNEVRLEYQGQPWIGRLGSRLESTPVFKPYWVFRRRGGQIERREIPDTLLHLKAGSNNSVATVTSRYPNPFRKLPNVIAFEAINLSTRSGRLQLRFVDKRSGEPALNCQVAVNDWGFDREGKIDDYRSPDRNGYVNLRRPLEHVAFVTVNQAGATLLRMPIAMTAEVNRRVYQIDVDPAAAAKSTVMRELRRLRQDADSLIMLMNFRFREITSMNNEKRYEQALEMARETVKTAESFRNTCQLGLQQVMPKVREQEIETKLPGSISGGLRAANAQIEDLASLTKSLQQVVENARAIDRADVMLKLGKQALELGNVDETIAQYERALAEYPDRPAVRQTLNKLKEIWRIKSPQHAAARKVIFEQWAAADLTGVESLLPSAKSAFETLKQVNDYLTARKLYATLDGHINDIGDLLNQLEGRDSQADRDDRQKIARLAEQVAGFHDEVLEFVNEGWADLAGDAETPSAGPDGRPTSPPAPDGGNSDGAQAPLDGIEEEEEPIN